MHEKSPKSADILLVSYNDTIIASLQEIFEKYNYSLTVTASHSDSLQWLKKINFDLILVDTQLSDSNGYSLCYDVKKNFDIPVIFISETNDETCVVSALEMGADDYICTPLRQKELIARINTIFRRTGKAHTVLTEGNLKIDTVKGIVTKNGREIYLSALEYRILLVFLSNKGIVLSRQKLLEEIWDEDGTYVSDNTLTVYIKRIREKIEDDITCPKVIKTVRGKGYKVG